MMKKNKKKHAKEKTSDENCDVIQHKRHDHTQHCVHCQALLISTPDQVAQEIYVELGTAPKCCLILGRVLTAGIRPPNGESDICDVRER